jgi:hypothetical protein
MIYFNDSGHPEFSSESDLFSPEILNQVQDDWVNYIQTASLQLKGYVKK